MTWFEVDQRGTGNTGVPVTTQVSLSPFPEHDYLELLLACIRKVMTLRNHDIMGKAVAQMNAKLSRHSTPIIPPSHEWSDLTNRLLFLRYYAEAVNEIGGDGRASQDELIRSIVFMEIEYENQNHAHQGAYRALYAKVYGNRLRLPEPPPPEKEPELDPETKATIERNQVKEKLEAYMQSLSQGAQARDKAYAILVRAYVDTVSDLSVPLREEYDDQKERAEKHYVLEYLQANDFPFQYEKLFPVLYTLLNNARDLLTKGRTDEALQQLDTAQNLFDYLAKLLYDYESGKIRKGTRVVIVILVLKAISRLILSIVVFKNVKGLVSQLVALIAINLIYQQLDHSIGIRERGLSGREAVKDAALELLTAKITAKISQVVSVKFNINPKSISLDVMNSLTSTVLGSLEEEFMKLGSGVSFVGFLKNLRAKFSNPEYWIETVIVMVLARNYTTTSTVSLPMNKNFARAATVATVLTLSPKASADTAPSKPPIVEVMPQHDAATAAGAKTTSPVVGSKATASPGVQEAAVGKPANAAVDQGVPTQQQRGVNNVTLSPSTDPTTPGKPPIQPLATLGLLGMAVVVSKNSKRGKILKLFQDARKLLDKIADPKAKKEVEDRLDKLRKEYDSSNDHSETRDRIQAIRNKINEIFAEEQINFILEHNLPSFRVKRIIAKVAVPRRGNKGPEIVDMAYKVELLNGKIAFLIIESKYGRSTLGWVKYGKTEVRQFSPEWFEMRIDEIAKQDAAFAKQLADAWKTGLIAPYVMKIAADGSPKAFIDFSAEWTKYGKP